MKVTLTEIKGPNSGRVFEFTTPDIFLAGRAKDAHIRFSEEDPYISRRQFLLEISPPKCVIKNLSKKNHACVNKMPITSKNLCNGDVIEIGYTQLLVGIESDAQLKHVRCPSCHEFMDLMENEQEDVLCPNCSTSARITARNELAEAGEILCSCGVDLTDRANLDGNALRLKNEVEYCCESCIKRIIIDSNYRIGDYTVIRSLGKGGMGEVFLVYHPETARILILKQIGHLTEQTLIQRFQREVHLLCNLDHKNLVRFVDSSLGEQRPYMIMTYANSGNLDDLILEKGKLSISEAVYYITGVLNGLSYIHQRGVVHRDIKPENILFQKIQGALVPKISDFGVAKRYLEAGGSMLTTTNFTMGTPLFLPPEQIYNFRNVRETGDIFSIGVTLYYSITGMLPYNFPSSLEIELYQKKNHVESDDVMDIVHQMGFKGNPFLITAFQDAIPVQEKAPDIPDAFAEVLNKAIDKDPDQRFQSADDFRKAIIASI